MKFYISTYDENPDKWVKQLESGIILGHTSFNNLISDVANWLTSENYSDDIKFFEYEKSIHILNNIQSVDVKFIREIPLAEIKKLIMLK